MLITSFLNGFWVVVVVQSYLEASKGVANILLHLKQNIFLFKYCLSFIFFHTLASLFFFENCLYRSKRIFSVLLSQLTVYSSYASGLNVLLQEWTIQAFFPNSKSHENHIEHWKTFYHGKTFFWKDIFLRKNAWENWNFWTIFPKN